MSYAPSLFFYVPIYVSLQKKSAFVFYTRILLFAGDKDVDDQVHDAEEHHVKQYDERLAQIGGDEVVGCYEHDVKQKNRCHGLMSIQSGTKQLVVDMVLVRQERVSAISDS